MSRRLFRRTPPAVLVAVLTSVAGFPLVLATPAQAATDTPSVVVARDGALVRGDATLSSPTTIAGVGASDVSGLSASADGSRFAEELESGTGTGTDASIHTKIAVRDASGQLVSVLDDRVFTFSSKGLSGSVAFRPALSPDGSRAVWSAIDIGHGSAVLKTAPTGGGTPTTVSGSTNLGIPQYLDSATLLTDGAEDNKLYTLPSAGGTATAVAGMADDINGFSVSGDGSLLAYTVTPDVGDDVLKVAPLTHVGAVYTVGTPTVLTTSYSSSDEGPAFSRDNGTVYWAQDLNSGDTDIYSVPTAGGTPTNLTHTENNLETSVAVVDQDGVAPAPATALPFTLAGTSATIRWSLPEDADLSGVTVMRTGGTGPATKTYVAAPRTSVVDTGLTPGTTYTYAIDAVDRSGNHSTSATRQLTAIAPTATFPDPTALSYYTSPAFRVFLPAVGTYTVQVRTNGTGALTTWLSDVNGASHVYTAAKAGSSYGFLVTVKDAFGNSSAPTGAGIAVVPYDQSRASFTGSVLTQALRDRYLGSATLLRTAGSAARLVVNGNRLQLLGERCASCGVMDVYVDGTRVAGIDTHSTSRHARVVLYTRALPAGNHTITVKARGTAGHPNVVLDGFGVRH